MILSSETSTFKVTFDKPLSVEDKKIALKSIHYPKIHFPTTYRIWLNTVHGGTLAPVRLPTVRYYTSSQLVAAIYVVMLEAHRALLQRSRFIQTPPPTFHNSRASGSVIEFQNTGVSIKEYHFSMTEIMTSNVFELFDFGTVHLNEGRLEVDFHELSIAADNPTDPISALVYCNAIVPTYMNEHKHQILDVLCLNSKEELNIIEINEPLYHNMIFGEVLTLSFVVQTMYGESIDIHEHLDHPWVLKLLFK